MSWTIKIILHYITIFMEVIIMPTIITLFYFIRVKMTITFILIQLQNTVIQFYILALKMIYINKILLLLLLMGNGGVYWIVMNMSQCKLNGFKIYFICFFKQNITYFFFFLFWGGIWRSSQVSWDSPLYNLIYLFCMQTHAEHINFPQCVCTA